MENTLFEPRKLSLWHLVDISRDYI